MHCPHIWGKIAHLYFWSPGLLYICIDTYDAAKQRNPQSSQASLIIHIVTLEWSLHIQHSNLVHKTPCAWLLQNEQHHVTYFESTSSSTWACKRSFSSYSAKRSAALFYMEKGQYITTMRAIYQYQVWQVQILSHNWIVALSYSLRSSLVNSPCPRRGTSLSPSQRVYYYWIKFC